MDMLECFFFNAKTSFASKRNISTEQSKVPLRSLFRASCVKTAQCLYRTKYSKQRNVCSKQNMSKLRNVCTEQNMVNGAMSVPS